jgi:L-asparaginase
MNTSSILILYTGGTIGMIKDRESGVLKPFDFDNMYNHMPALKTFPCELNVVSFDPLIDSSNIAPEHWIRMVEVIESNYEEYDGFVILHGSDTMSYTASALSFMLENLNKPVIITGSQLPMGELRTDGRENFITAIEIASTHVDDTPIVPEVALYFEDFLYRGNRTYKYNAENFNAFVSGNFPALADVGIYINYHPEYILKPNFKKLKTHKNLSGDVAVLKLFPGMSAQYVDAILNMDGLRAVVMESFGSGNATTEDWFHERLRTAIKKGIIIVNLTQCLSGTVDMNKYETGKKLQDLGIISGCDMTSSAALTKLMVLLGEYDQQNTVIEKFLKPLCGEMDKC